MNKEIEYLVNDTKKYEYISFDVFDTLLFRKVYNYKDIFDLVEERYNLRYPDKINKFREIRIFAEQNARNESVNDDITFDDIYNRINYEDDKKNKLKDIELKSEIESVFPNITMVNFLKNCKKRGKKIIITSDMYLSKDTILEMLKKCGISDEYIDDIFISGEIGFSKRSGKLFDYIIKKLNISSDMICHIGDNKVSDIKIPQKMGISSFLRICDSPIKVYNEDSKNWKVQYIVRSAQSSYLNNDSISAYRIAYSSLGPFIVSFCEWLKTISNEGMTIGFVAREGYLLKKSFDILYPNQNSFYFRYNKNVLRLPILFINSTVDCFLNTIPYRNSYTKYDLYELLHIDHKLKLDKINDLTFFENIQRSEMYSHEFEEWFYKVLDVIHDDMEEQFITLTNDLISLSKTTQKVLLVNNSINGSAQNILNQICKKAKINLTFYGAQFIATQKCKNRLKDKLYVFFDNDGITCEYKKIFANYSILVEHLMFEEIGSAKIIINNGLKREYVLDDLGIEEKNHDIVIPIQDNVMQYINNQKTNMIYIDPAVGVSLLIEFLSNPYKDDVEYLRCIYDRDVHGENMLIEMNVIGENNIIKQIKNIRDYDKVKWIDGLIAIDPSYRFVGQIFKKYKFLKDKERY